MIYADYKICGIDLLIILSPFAPTLSEVFTILKKKKKTKKYQKVTAAFSEQLVLPPGVLSYMKPRKQLYAGEKAFAHTSVPIYI